MKKKGFIAIVKFLNVVVIIVHVNNKDQFVTYKNVNAENAKIIKILNY